MNADDESQEQSGQIKVSAFITIPSKIIEISMNTNSPCILIHLLVSMQHLLGIFLKLIVSNKFGSLDRE